MYRHFVIKYDTGFDYPKICEQLFADEWLCVAEKIDINAHVHFQGRTTHGAKAFKDKTTELTRDHYLRKADPNSRPVHHRKLDATGEGFQYMMKSPDLVLSTTFSPEKLEELHKASEDHVKDLKERCKRVVVLAAQEVLRKGKTCEQIHQAAVDAMEAYYDGIQKELPIRHADHMLLGWLRGVSLIGSTFRKFIQRKIFKSL